MQEIVSANNEDFTQDERACKSDFTFYFYRNIKIRLGNFLTSDISKMYVDLFSL